MAIDYLCYQLAEWEDFIFRYEESFLETFGRGAEELIHVRFHSEGVEFVAMSYEGYHFVDGVKLDRFKEWCEEIML